MATVSGAHLVERFFPGTGASYERCVRLTTLGLDARWKRRLLAHVPRRATVVLDLACGTGLLTFEILRRHPDARVVGVDITEDYLAVARAKHARRGGAVEFLLGNAETATVADRGPFDVIVSSYLPKYVDAATLLANVAPALRPGGVIALHDFTCPRDPRARRVWNAYLALVNPLARRLFPGWELVFDATLADLLRRTKWVHDFRRALPRQGFHAVRVERLTFGAATLVSATKWP